MTLIGCLCQISPSGLHLGPALVWLGPLHEVQQRLAACCLLPAACYLRRVELT